MQEGPCTASAETSLALWSTTALLSAAAGQLSALSPFWAVGVGGLKKPNCHRLSWITVMCVSVSDLEKGVRN